jgi:class 3 adenylate cyclase/predicted ATPase
MQCPQCHEENDAGLRFCESCGATLARLCPSCGHELKPQAKFCGKCGASLSEPAAPQPAAPPELTPVAAGPASVAERRQLTVLFCDLVDSTRLAAGLDPEDWREVVRAYQQVATRVVERFEGHVAQYLGDGLLVYFSYPQAHEDDAERAVRAGLGIVDAVAQRNPELQQIHNVSLAVRIGIHTGPVVVGEMGGGAKRETLAMGDTTNVAARLQGIADPDTVVFSAATLRLVQGVFVTRDLGSRDLKGVGDVRIFRAVQPSGVRSRLDVAAATGLTAFVGRDQELMILEDRWLQVQEGRGHALLICGEAGIGKSRLVQAFRERLGELAHTWLECRASPYTQDSALYPVVELQRQGLRFRPEDPPDTKLALLETGLAAAGFELAAAVPLMANFHTLPLPDRYQEPVLSPEGRRKRTLDFLVEWVLRLGQQQPVVLLMEDLHWIDPSTQELLGQILEQIPRATVLLLLTYRPDFEAPWGTRSYVTPMLLSRFTRAQLRDLVINAARGRAIPQPWVDDILRRADGVPLFAEELTRAVLDTNPEPPRGGVVPALQIPDTLQDLLTARLDALGPVKELAQLGAVLGREFSYDLILEVSTLKGEQLQHALAKAVREEIFYQRGTPPEATYLFKHALIRDAAYQSLLKRDRRRSHLRVAEAILDRLPDVVTGHPELLGHHFSEAGEVEQAIHHFQRAGEQAAERSANAEAIGHFEKALHLLAQLPDTRDRKLRELVLQVAIGAPSQLVQGYRTPETERAYTRALELCREVGETPQLSQALWGLYSFYLVGSDLDIASELGRQLLEVAERAEDQSVVLLGHLALGVPRVFQGDFAEALGHLECTISLYDVRRDRRAAYRYGQDPGVMARPFAAFSHWFRGQADRARALSGEAIDLAREIAHPYSLGLAYAYAAVLQNMLRDHERALERADDVIAISKEQEFPLWRGIGTVSRSRALAELGFHDGRIEEIQKGLADVAATGTVLGGPMFIAYLADAQAAAGRIDDAIGTLNTAIGLSESTGSRYWDAELHRRKGEIFLRLKDHTVDESEALFRKALDIARSQEGKTFELRAATSLARLWQGQGRRGEARDLLTAIYDWFTCGFDTQDLKDAKALLQEL